MSTFRGIGARVKTQGGGSLNNLTITNQLSSAKPLNVFANEVLVNEVILALVKDPVFLQGLSSPALRAFISNQLSDLPALGITVRPYVAAQLAVDDAFIDAVAAKISVLLEQYAATTLVTTPETSFYQLLAQNLSSYSDIILGDQRDQIIQNLVTPAINDVNWNNLYTQPVSQLMKNYLKTESTAFRTLVSQIFSNQVITFQIPQNIFYNKMTIPLFKVSLYFLQQYLINFTPTVFTNSEGFKITNFKLLLLNTDLTLYSTISNTSFSPPVSNVIISGDQGEFINGNTYPLNLYVCVYAEMTEGYIVSSGSASLNFIRSTGSIALSLINTPMVLTLSANPVEFFDLNDSLQYYQDSIVSGGIMQYSSGIVTWSIQIFNSATEFIAETAPESVTYIASITWTYPMRVFTLKKFDYIGDDIWEAALKFKNLPYYQYVTLNALTSDVNSNAYLCGNYWTNYFFYRVYDEPLEILQAYNSDGTLYIPDIFYSGNVSSYCGYCVKYNKNGYVEAFATTQPQYDDGYRYHTITYVHCDSYTNAVYLSCSTDVSSMIVQTFNNTILNVPKGNGFIVKLNQKGSANFDEWWAIIGNNLNEAALEVTTDPLGSVYALFLSPHNSSVSIYHAKKASPDPPAFTLTNSLSSAMFVFAKYNTDGTCLWASKIESNNFLNDGSEKITADGNGNSYVFLTSNASIEYNTTTINLPASRPRASTILQLDPNGNYLRNAQLTYCDIISLKTIRNEIYATASFDNSSYVFSIYRNGTLQRQIGTVGKKGVAILKFDASLNVSLVGYSRTTI